MKKYPFEDYFAINNKNWLNNLKLNIIKIKEKLKLTDLKINPKARFGVVVFCKQNKKHVVLKLVDSDSAKGQFELYALTNLSYSFINKTLECSMIDGYYLSNKLNELKMPEDTEVITRFNMVKPIFIKVVEEWKNNIEGKDTYWQKFVKKIRDNNIGNISYDMQNHIYYASLLYQKKFNVKCRLSHGDLHEKNIMKKCNKLYAIDPLGGFAPFEFEFVKYIENQLFVLPFNKVENALDVLLNQFKLLGVEPIKLLYALYIDSVERTVTSHLLKDSADIIQKGLERISLIKYKINMLYGEVIDP